MIVWSALLTFLCSLLFFSNYSSMTIVSIDVGLLLMLIHYSCSVDQSWCITASEQCNGDICIVYGAWSKRHLQQIPGNLARIIKEECDMQYRGPSHTWFPLTRFSNRQCFTTLHVNECIRVSWVGDEVVKVHIFWEGHKFLWNLPLTFDYSTYSQK